METILSVLQVIISVIVVFLVLMHSGKDSGLSGAFGVGSGAGPLGGGAARPSARPVPLGRQLLSALAVASRSHSGSAAGRIVPY